MRAYVKDNFVDKGMCADFSIHDKGTGNPHVHIMLTVRPLKENGAWGAKIAGLPDHLKDTARDFFENWFQYVDPLPETWKFIKELKARGVPIYLLSNASTRFAERALEDHPILKEFDGIVFSAPLKMAKPGHDIYYHLFNEFNLLPRECFFIDDTVENVIASKELGMESILFTGDIEAVKRAIEF